MDKLITWLVPALISAVLGFITALATTSYKFRKQSNLEKEKEKESIRLKYLNPLLISAMDLLERIDDIKKRRLDEGKRKKMIVWFSKIKKDSRLDKKDLEGWVNDEGYFAMSTLYITAVYFAHASKIRIELPFIEMGHGDDKTLLKILSKIRKAIGGKWGIWETIQDSLGTYLLKNDQTINPT